MHTSSRHLEWRSVSSVNIPPLLSNVKALYQAPYGVSVDFPHVAPYIGHNTRYICENDPQCSSKTIRGSQNKRTNI